MGSILNEKDSHSHTSTTPPPPLTPPPPSAPPTSHNNDNHTPNVVNRDLTGHRLLLVMSRVPEGWSAHLRSRFPGLEIAHAEVDPWSEFGKKLGEEAWHDATVLFTGPQLPAAPEQAPGLQLVQLQSAGANYVLEEKVFRDTDVPFCTSNGVAAPPIAEWVICTYLAHQHQIPRYLENMKEGNWERVGDHMSTDDAVSKRVGILGYGSIGRQVARLATAMGMEVYAYTNRAKLTPESRVDTSYHPHGLGDPEGVLPAKWFSGDDDDSDSLTQFLSSGLDLLVVAVPLTPRTRGMLGEREFKLLSSHDDTDNTQRRRRRRGKCYVSNIGRGPTIVTDALVKALDEGWISGAALDVTDPEPLPRDHALWKRDNVVITPHVSGATSAYMDRCLVILEHNLRALAEGRGDFLNLVSRQRGY
ncbi:D-isomer specific 2-hydroxyacid dehydrogenase [Xylariaceae sp. FL0594]|nr:D-isomer specific 2-hydroxyacid dehydrogenase [Xylariaceae sp. FL0594]